MCLHFKGGWKMLFNISFSIDFIYMYKKNWIFSDTVMKVEHKMKLQPSLPSFSLFLECPHLQFHQRIQSFFLT